jgi:hypothetical protein
MPADRVAGTTTNGKASKSPSAGSPVQTSSSSANGGGSAADRLGYSCGGCNDDSSGPGRDGGKDGGLWFLGAVGLFGLLRRAGRRQGR